MKIQDPEKFQLATVVNKNSRTGITTNKRLLVVKGGYLYYYSTVPKTFRGDVKALNALHELPKCSIQIINIKAIKGYQDTSAYFSLQFQAKHMMERQDIRKTLTLQEFNFAPKNTKQMVTWQFTCENKQIKKLWVNSLRSLQNYYSKQKVNIQRFFSNINKKEEQPFAAERRSTNRNSFMPWKEQSPPKLNNDSFKKKKQQLALQFLNASNLQNQTNSSNQNRSLSNSKLQKYSSSKQIPTILPYQQKKTQKIVQQRQNKLEIKQQQPKIPQIQIPKQQQFKEKQPQQYQQIKDQKTEVQIQGQIIENDQSAENVTPLPKIKESPNQNIQSSFQLQKITYFSANSSRKDFYTLLDQIFIGDFQQKVDKQKYLLQQMSNFKAQAVKNFTGMIQSKEISSKQLFYQKGRIQFKIGLVHTQSFQINNNEKIFYNEDTIKSLKQQFKIYRTMFSQIIQSLKACQNNNNRFSLRVPLSCFIQYRGICALAIDSNQEYNQSSSQSMKYEKSLIQKMGFDAYNFSLRVNQNTGLFIAYVKKPFKSQNKHHNVTFQPPIDHNFITKAQKQKASTSLVSLQKYIQGLQRVKEFHGICPKQQILKVLQISVFCKKLRKLYRSAQGQIDQTSFFNLVLNRDPTLANLLQKSGCENIPKFNGLVFDFIQHYFGVALQIDSLQKSTKKQKVLATHPFPLIREYCLDSLELIQSLNKFTKYIQTNQIQLAYKTLTMNQQLFQIIPKTEKQQTQALLEIIYKRAQISYAQNDFLESISLCKTYLEKCDEKKYVSSYSLKKLPIFLFMLKTYANFSQFEFSKVLNQVNQLVTFNFGDVNSTFISIWSLASHFYAHNFNNQIVAMKLLNASLEMTKKLFGGKSKQQAQLLLDLSRIYTGIDFLRCKAFLNQAKQMFKFYGNDQDIVRIQAYQGNLALYQGKTEECQKCCSQISFLIENLKNKPINKAMLKQLLIVQYQLCCFLKNDSKSKQIIEQLWQFDFYSRQSAFEIGYKLVVKLLQEEGAIIILNQFSQLVQRIFHTGITGQSNDKQQEDSEFLSKQQALMKFEQLKKEYGHQRITETISECVQSRDPNFIKVLIGILGKEKISFLNQNFTK